MTSLDPDDFIISRKRKKYKFAKFANSELCFEFDEWHQQPVDVVEVGAGTAQFSLALAKKHPSKQFIALDVKADRLQVGAYQAMELGLTNIQFLRARADQLLECFTSGTLESVWLTFPDPFPRPRSARRRMTHPIYLECYKALLKDNGSLYLKHDSSAFFSWSLEQMVAEKWQITELSFDLHESDLADEYKTITTYEKRWHSEGKATHFVKANPS